jgi:hypothetical protein
MTCSKLLNQIAATCPKDFFPIASSEGSFSALARTAALCQHARLLAVDLTCVLVINSLKRILIVGAMILG